MSYGALHVILKSLVMKELKLLIILFPLKFEMKGLTRRK